MSSQMKKMLIIVGIVFGLIFGWYGVQKILFWVFLATYTPPPITISATTATAKTWQLYLSSVGTLTAVNGVDISSESAGIVKEVRFTSGQSVKKGDILVLLDTSVEQAELQDNQAQLKLAQINYDRDKTLFKKNVISQAQLDTTVAKLQQAQSGVDTTLAKIHQKTITAPFDGKIGIRLIDLGQFVPAGTAMVSLQSMDPLFVRLSLPEQYLPDLYVQQPVDIKVTLNSSGEKLFRGSITAINSKVDQSTRNILIQATVPNKNLQLYPGMFAWVQVWLREKKNVITLPQTAISYSLHGDSVFIIKEEKAKFGKSVLRAYRQYVKVGDRRGSEVSIAEGVKAGDQVITSGQLKLQNGIHVVVDNSVEL